jgi:hypothetical protein
MNDLHNSMRTARVLSPAAAGTTGTGRTGTIIDRADYGGVEFIMDYGAATTTGYAVAVTVLEGDVTGTMTSVADADLLGTEALAGLAVEATARTSGVGKNVTKRVGYKGACRYVTVKEVPTGAATGIVGCVAILHNPKVIPTANP